MQALFALDAIREKFLKQKQDWKDKQAEMKRQKTGR